MERAMRERQAVDADDQRGERDRRVPSEGSKGRRKQKENVTEGPLREKAHPFAASEQDQVESSAKGAKRAAAAALKKAGQGAKKRPKSTEREVPGAAHPFSRPEKPITAAADDDGVEKVRDLSHGEAAEAAALPEKKALGRKHQGKGTAADAAAEAEDAVEDEEETPSIKKRARKGSSGAQENEKALGGKAKAREKTSDAAAPRAGAVDAPADLSNALQELNPADQAAAAASMAQRAFLVELQGLLGAHFTDGSATVGPPSVPKPTLKEGEDRAGDAQEQYWQSRFEQLSALRQTEPERQLAEYRRRVEERDAAQKELINHLKAMVQKEPAEEELKEARVLLEGDNGKVGSPIKELEEEEAAAAEVQLEGAVTSMEEAGDADVNQELEKLQEKVDRQRRLLFMYQQLSSLVIKEESSDETASEPSEWVTYTYLCTAINHLHKRAVRFRLEQKEDTDADVHSSDQLLATASLLISQ
ncbi:unnamed protein product [Chrysoparadoxa australica]